MSIRAGIAELGAWVAGLDWQDVPTEAQDRVRLVLLDTLGVTIAGARTPESVALRRAWTAAPGPVRVIGGGSTAAAHDAMWLNGTSACCLELDEGNKFAQGHPAAHVLFAVLAEAQARPAPGAEVLGAFLAGHEVAARFGRAMRRDPAVHTHGHWGALGAAAAVARLRHADGVTVAAAIDAAAGLVLATPWESVLRGSFVRNTWMGAANVAGTVAATLAEAGLAGPDGNAELTLGGLLGELDPEPITAELGTRLDVTTGYFKRHASCSYTHPCADAVIDLREEGLRSEAVESILVETHRLAAPLDRREVSTRLAAMFSIPFVVATALLDGEVVPAAFDEERRRSPEVTGLMGRVEVRESAGIDARLPERRGARVTVRTREGATLVREVDNPVGDADHRPFGRPEVLAKLTRLDGEETTEELRVAIERLEDSPAGGALLAEVT